MNLTTFSDGDNLGKYFYSKLDSIMQIFIIITPTKAIGHIVHIGMNV